MKNTMILPLAILTCFSISSCVADRCKDFDCRNGGECIDDGCECPSGFSGPRCEVEDKCVTENVSCLNGGECEDGDCECSFWYEGESCETSILEQVLGTYVGVFRCDGFPQSPDTVEITGSAGALKMIRYNGENLDLNEGLEAREFAIPNHAYESSQGAVTVHGYGEVSGDNLTIEFEYNYYGNGGERSCTFEGSRQ